MAPRQHPLHRIVSTQAQAGRADGLRRLGHEGWEAVIGLKPTCSWVGQQDLQPRSTNFGDQPKQPHRPVVLGCRNPPVLNQKVLEYAVKAASGLQLQVASTASFDRTAVFHPPAQDYQISQFDQPIAETAGSSGSGRKREKTPT